MWYNEAFLAPFFLKHYKKADLITIFYDKDTTDDTLNEINRHKQCDVRIVPFKFPYGLDEFIKISILNDAYKESKADYIIIVDADEFVFFDTLRFNKKIYWCRFAQIMRQDFEPSPHPNHPINTWRYGFYDKMYIKPSIVRVGLNLSFSEGHHRIFLNGKLKKSGRVGCKGAHWNMIERYFYINRILHNRAPRQSQVNIEAKLDYQYNNRTLENLELEYNKKFKQCKRLVL